MKKRILTITLLALTASSPALPQRGGAAEAQFQAAQHKEQVEGDLRAAIQLYQKVADSKDSSRAIAAQALLRVGRCYESLGSVEARKAYERVVRQYADQSQFAGEARSRLAAADKKESGSGELTARLVTRLHEITGPYEGLETPRPTAARSSTGIQLTMTHQSLRPIFPLIKIGRSSRGTSGPEVSTCLQALENLLPAQGTAAAR